MRVRLQAYKDTIGIGNVGRMGGGQQGGVNVKLVDLANYIYEHGGWDLVRRLTSLKQFVRIPGLWIEVDFMSALRCERGHVRLAICIYEHGDWNPVCAS